MTNRRGWPGSDLSLPSTRELIVDQATGALPEVGTSGLRDLANDPEQGYRPSANLQRAIRARDVTCRFPGCRRSAFGTHSGTDLDHTMTWRSPSGRTYDTEPWPYIDPPPEPDLDEPHTPPGQARAPAPRVCAS